MKISKLFHWLYACLMLLPIFAFGVTGIYYALNQTATQSETIEEQPIYYQSNEVESVNDLAINNIYQINNTSVSSNTNYTYMTIDYDLINNQIELASQYTSENVYKLISGNSLKILLAVYQSNGTTYISAISIDNSLPFAIIPKEINMTSTANIIDKISYSNYVFVKEYTNITTTNSVSASVINAWNDTWRNPLFSWSGNSFLKPPLDYVCGLFGVGSDNTFSYALSYWCSVSIIWLIFDVLMYVPLLTHRWLDKGVIE